MHSADQFDGSHGFFFEKNVSCHFCHLGPLLAPSRKFAAALPPNTTGNVLGQFRNRHFVISSSEPPTPPTPTKIFPSLLHPPLPPTVYGPSNTSLGAPVCSRKRPCTPVLPCPPVPHIRTLPAAWSAVNGIASPGQRRCAPPSAFQAAVLDKRGASPSSHGSDLPERGAPATPDAEHSHWHRALPVAGAPSEICQRPWKQTSPTHHQTSPPPPPCDIPSGCCSFTGPWTLTRSSLHMLRRVAAFCRPLRLVLLLVSFPRSRSPVVGVPGLCWMRRDVPFARQRRPIIGVLGVVLVVAPPPPPPPPTLNAPNHRRHTTAWAKPCLGLGTGGETTSVPTLLLAGGTGRNALEIVEPARQVSRSVQLKTKALELEAL